MESNEVEAGDRVTTTCIELILAAAGGGIFWIELSSVLVSLGVILVDAPIEVMDDMGWVDWDGRMDCIRMEHFLHRVLRKTPFPWASG